MKRLLSIVLIGLALVGCQTVKHQTASGRPEITSKRLPADVKAAWAGFLVNRGYIITKDSDLQVIAEKEPENALASVLFGSRYDGVPKLRITATLLSIGAGTRMLADFAIVTNPGSAFERVTPLNNSPETVSFQLIMNDMQEMLDKDLKPGDVVAQATQRSLSRRLQVQAASAPTSPVQQ